MSIVTRLVKPFSNACKMLKPANYANICISANSLGPTQEEMFPWYILFITFNKNM